MRTFLGVDGGGSKTEFLLIDEQGEILAAHQEGCAYHLEIGLESLRALLARGIRTVLSEARLEPQALTCAFLGIPAFGEDSQMVAELGSLGEPVLENGQYRCGNDMICGWAGALACQDGINIVAGTGSIAYGEYSGRTGRAGGWGELFSDEGSSYWVARLGLSLFSRMSDGRSPRGALYELLRAHFGLERDLDLCAAVYGGRRADRSQVAKLTPVIAAAARAGDAQAAAIFSAGVRELIGIIDCTRERLEIPAELAVAVSYSGGMFKLTDLVLEPLQAGLAHGRYRYALLPPRLPPSAGAALYAARCTGLPLAAAAVARLQDGCRER